MLRNRINFSVFRLIVSQQRRINGSACIEKNPESMLDDPLTDTFGRHHTYLRISLTEKCNLRCKYCMPEEGVQLTEKSKLLTAEEVIYLAKLFVDQGVKKIRLTGGEPTIRRDLAHIIRELKQIQGLENVSITTNGLVLTRKLVELQKSGLDGLNISLDTLDPNKYERITRRKGMERVLMGIDLALQLGYSPVKINCVVMKGFNDDEIKDFVTLTQQKDVDVRFIEYMPFSGNKWEVDKMLKYNEMLDKIKSIWPKFKQLENHPNDTSKAWKVPGYVGQVGFITSMSNMFCGTCNRIRITADGNLKVCLFGNTEVSLRDAIRSGVKEDDLTTMISIAIKRKEKHHGEITSHERSKFYSIPSSKTKHSFIMSFRRAFSSMSDKDKSLTHVDGEGKANMVNISDKRITSREATARGSIYVGPNVMKLIIKNNIEKGDVLGISKIAGIMASKKTADLIPLCHNIQLNSVKINTSLDEESNSVFIEATACCDGKTGVEMEALTAVTISALTIYDMCKAVSKDMKINNIYLVKKSGGSKGDEVYVKSYDDISLPKKTVFFPGGI